ncbi:MAG: hypothetical protein IPP88_09305 [Betaproteobacteria bacterium]|nr:hypothetical protein [Betaproteobacteria bacterium]
MNLKFLTVLLATVSTFASAYCASDGKSAQSVAVSVSGKQIARWETKEADIHRVKLPAGFEVGIQIDPAAAEVYRKMLDRFPSSPAIDEMVRIQIYDMSGAEPKLLSNTWGGANSKQGFGPRGGANGIPELIDQIELWFHKPVCVTRESPQSSQ